MTIAQRAARSRYRTISVVLVLACAVGLPCSREGNRALAADKAVAWKPNDQAMVRVDDHALQEWGVYQAGKKTNPLVLQMGSRYLLIDQQKRQVFELDPAKIIHKGTELSWDPVERPEKPLETSNWVVKDVGQAYRVNVRLVAEGRVLDVQIPHPLDLRNIH